MSGGGGSLRVEAHRVVVVDHGGAALQGLHVELNKLGAPLLQLHMAAREGAGGRDVA